MQGREGNTLSTYLRNFWDKGTTRSLTRNSPLKATDAHVSIIGHIMRCQEYLGLQWKDINFEQSTATVQRAVVWHRTGGGWHFSQPKTAKSRRTIPMPSSIMHELRQHRIRQNEARLKLGAAWHQNDLVFPSQIGTPLNPPNVTRRFKRILEKANIRTSIRLYDLRHTQATLLLQAGVNPKIVSERLGHSSIVLTLDVYSHVLPNMQKDATAELERLIFPKSGTF